MVPPGERTQASAACIRTACLSGRRYEKFNSLAEWKEFVRNAKAAIARAVPIVERNKIPLGIENHKDWTTEEQLALLASYESEYVGATLDTGNNIALLDDPIGHVKALARYAVSTHLKDMAAKEYEQGFLLAEVPFGDGFLDMKRIAAVIRKARPRTRMTLEMITRDPLRVPCLTEKYWATFPNRNGRYLARTLAMVRSHPPPQPLPGMEGLDHAARLRRERENVERCLRYAVEVMGL